MRHQEKERAGVKLSSWPEIGSDGDVLWMRYVPKGVTGYDDDDEMPTPQACTNVHSNTPTFILFIAKNLM